MLNKYSIMSIFFRKNIKLTYIGLFLANLINLISYITSKRNFDLSLFVSILNTLVVIDTFIESNKKKEYVSIGIDKAEDGTLSIIIKNKGNCYLEDIKLSIISDNFFNSVDRKYLINSQCCFNDINIKSLDIGHPIKRNLINISNLNKNEIKNMYIIYKLQYGDVCEVKKIEFEAFSYN